MRIKSVTRRLKKKSLRNLSKEIINGKEWNEYEEQ